MWWRKFLPLTSIHFTDKKDNVRAMTTSVCEVMTTPSTQTPGINVMEFARCLAYFVPHNCRGLCSREREREREMK
jgi:hypothetical protein